MKIDFYLRVFFTFLFFSFIITYLNFSTSTDEKIKLKQLNEWNIVYSKLQDKKDFIQKSINLIDVKLENLLNIKSLKEIKIEDFNEVNIIDLKYYDLKKDIIELKKKHYFFDINKNNLVNKNYSKVYKDKMIYLVYKRADKVLELSYDMNVLFEVINKINATYDVFNLNGDYLFSLKDEENLDNLNPNTTLKDEYPKYYFSILKNDKYTSEKLVSRKVKLNEQVTYIVVSKFDIKNYSKDKKNYLNENLLYVIFLNIIISFLLSLVFSNSMGNIFRKVNNRFSVKDSDENNYKELNESLEIIDENVMILKTTTSGEIIDISKALCDFTKYVKNELIGHDYTKLLNNNLSKEYLDKVWKDIRLRKAKKFEINGMTKNGDSFWLDAFTQAVLNQFDEVIGYTFICENITQKKKIEAVYKDLDYQVEQYNSIFKHVNSGIAIMTLDGKFLRFNNAFVSFFEFTEDELTKDIKFSDLVDEESENINNILKEMKELKTLPNLEKVFINASGMKIHLEMSLSILPDNKSIVLIVNSLEDKRKQQEINQLLERKIQEELEKSRQKDEIHKQEQIKNAKLTSIGSLAAGITHEINTPLTYIKGGFELMGYDIEDLPDSDIKTRMLDDKVKIEDGLNRIANIVESMREISQKSSEAKEPTNIYSTLITVLTMAYNRSKQVAPIYLKDEVFEIGEFDKNKFEYYSKVQKQRIEQVWIVIINNALDELVKTEGYENRKLFIDIFLDNNDVVVRFKDNAGGIPTDVLPNIFDPFMSTKEHGGMGVGLNVAKNIVDQQNGNIKAFNEDDDAVFEVRLKIYKEKE